MIGGWILYLAVLLGCLVFHIAYQGWLAWLVLVVVFGLPFFSLALSLYPMLKTKLTVRCDSFLSMGAEVRAEIISVSKLPAPPWRSRLRITRTVTGERWRTANTKTLPSNHCGQLVCTPVNAYVYDYLGLFRLRVRHVECDTAIIRPLPISVPVPTDFDRIMAKSWRPKPGGGFSENHELRLYRPGDNLNQVHWKLSAKTGKLIIREAMEPAQGKLLITMDLNGSADQVDEKFGKLSWLGFHLLHRGTGFLLRVMTGNGLILREITTEEAWYHILDELLCMPPVVNGSALTGITSASWHYHIGGDRDEA